MKNEIYVKKSLGQNFLIDKNIINKIINVVPIKDKSILEVGPEQKSYVIYLKSKSKKAYCTGKDKNLAMNLEKYLKIKLL